MLSCEARERIDRLVNEVEGVAERIAAVEQSETAEELQCYALVYNWDDGFEVPTAIARHPRCDRGVALSLFWHADGLTWYQGGGLRRESRRPWDVFCRLVTEGLLEGRYPLGETSFDPSLGRVQLYQLRKEGVPEVLFTPVKGTLPAVEPGVREP